MKPFLLTIMLVCCIVVSPVFAQDESQKTETATNIDMDSVVDVLIVFLVLSIVFEVALTPIFNWRIFLAYFEGKGYKTPMTVVLAFLVFWGYNLDIITDLLHILTPNITIEGPTKGGQVLTALLIAGGSSGFFQVLKKLNLIDVEGRTRRLQEAQSWQAKRRGQKTRAKEVSQANTE